MISIQQQIETRIKAMEKGSILFPADFADLGGTEAVKKSLLRLTNKGLLKRLAFGIYLYPKESRLLGTVTPSIEEIATAIAERDKSRIVPTGVYALNRLGLSTQVPLNAVYLTDGAPRKVRVGKRQILFKKTTPKNLQAKGEMSRMIIQALREVGTGNVKPEVEKKLLTLLRKETQETIEHDMLLAPAWIRDIMRKAIKHEQ
ncbi:MAG: hypothetical protein EOO10_09205 [Chitinophagaceae bacterium]|nr:MAG: hypothetical protein EOO10_09205 [Chitinophagaceae bacterium]